jgi:hypothetical protein
MPTFVNNRGQADNDARLLAHGTGSLSVNIAGAGPSGDLLGQQRTPFSGHPGAAPLWPPHSSDGPAGRPYGYDPPQAQDTMETRMKTQARRASTALAAEMAAAALALGAAFAHEFSAPWHAS